MLATSGRQTRWNYADVQGPPERITPLYDNLLVRRLRDEEYKGLLVLPGMTQTAGGKWVRMPDTGPRKGVVVAAGRGDKSLIECLHDNALERPDGWGEECPDCDSQSLKAERISMDVKVGDTIIYPRFESSHVQIDGEAYTFVHEADVMAVLTDNEVDKLADAIEKGKLPDE